MVLYRRYWCCYGCVATTASAVTVAPLMLLLLLSPLLLLLKLLLYSCCCCCWESEGEMGGGLIINQRGVTDWSWWNFTWVAQWEENKKRSEREVERRVEKEIIQKIKGKDFHFHSSFLKQVHTCLYIGYKLITTHNYLLLHTTTHDLSVVTNWNT